MFELDFNFFFLFLIFNLLSKLRQASRNLPEVEAVHSQNVPNCFDDIKISLPLADSSLCSNYSKILYLFKSIPFTSERKLLCNREVRTLQNTD